MGAAITGERTIRPVMDTKGVTTLISDSGITRYDVNTAEWLISDRKNPPYWAFEKGIYLEKFDSVFHYRPSIKADMAYIIIRKSCEADGECAYTEPEREKLIRSCCGIRTRNVCPDRRVRMNNPTR